MADQMWGSDSGLYLQPRHGDQADAFTDESASLGQRGTQRIVSAGSVSAPPAVARLLGLAADEPVIARRRIMYLDDRPVELTDSYYPTPIAAGTALADPKKIKGGAITLLAELGYTVGSVIEDITVDVPTATDRESLGLSAGEPVLILTRTTSTADHRPIEVSVMTMPRGRHLRYRTQVG